ncbi:MAG: hypothetical protein CML20_02490 [Rheinheimera sp.]|uniref:phosphatase PAP2 family protein n=1 Tax=Arsukibacterium sp. UBA3155 TaxID=1946058 RepID=UPI000C9907E9|nr:phosphatase PAP2 family protein [Arsukibacterium sp. UBA3155]MAD73667.1 hypothetical protein [Rheinheimera sp.]
MVIKAYISDRTVYRLLLLYLIALLILDMGGGDIWLANKFYALEGYQWSLQQHWFTENILHKDARILNYVACALVLLLTGYFNLKRSSHKLLADSFAALSLSLFVSFVMVAYLKAITNIACPWDLTMFGGAEPYFHLLQNRPSYLPYRQCFPAGHASVGYAWLALFYFFKKVKPQWQFTALATGLILGVILGLAQQLRGAHFLSHDLTTLTLCMLSAKFCFMLFTPDNNKTTSSQR